jgi:hypothetical protein
MHHERRHEERQPVGFYIDQFLGEELLRYFATDLSMHGLHLESPIGGRQRTPRTLQLEIRLPKLGEGIWASAEVVHERADALFHGRGVRFTAMTPHDTRCLRDWLRENARTERFITHPARRTDASGAHDAAAPLSFLGLAAGDFRLPSPLRGCPGRRS